MSPTARRLLAALAVVLSLAVVVGGQARADAVAPEPPSGALTGTVMQRTGFAYLTGLRRFAAALLWNRLDPQMHDYYGGHAGLGEMVFMLPSVRAIVALDPNFIEAYYVAPEILIESRNEPGIAPAEAARRLQAGLDLAREGAANNPKSGIALASAAELLFTQADDLPGALDLAEAALRSDIVWRSDEEKWNAYAVIRAILEKHGDTARAVEVQAVMDAIANDPNATTDPVEADE